MALVTRNPSKFFSLTDNDIADKDSTQIINKVMFVSNHVWPIVISTINLFILSDVLFYNQDMWFSLIIAMAYATITFVYEEVLQMRSTALPIFRWSNVATPYVYIGLFSAFPFVIFGYSYLTYLSTGRSELDHLSFDYFYLFSPEENS